MSYQPPANQPMGYPPQPGAYPPPKPQSSDSTKTVIFIVLGVAAMAGLCIIGILVLLLVPAVMAARDAANKQRSLGNLKQIGVALHNYHDTYRSFPAAYVADSEGKPRMSWRTALLPFVEQQQLFEKYNSNLRWDDPANASVRQTRVPVYKSPLDPPGTNFTSYVVVTSEQQEKTGGQMTTAFPGARFVGMQDLIDGTSKTIAVVEIKNSNIEWSEPRDIDIDSLSTDPSAPNSIDLAGGALVLFADGSIRILPAGTTLENLKIMLGRLDGRAVPF